MWEGLDVGLCGGWVVARLRGWERGECVVWFFFFGVTLVSLFDGVSCV